MTRAFLFSGQGSQTVDMSAALAVSCQDCLQLRADRNRQKPVSGDELASTLHGTAMTCAECRSTFAAADYALGFSLSGVMARGTTEQLRRTEITQPAVLTVSVAEAYRLMSQGVMPDVVAGHSLGQYSALVVAGAIEFEQAAQLVAARGTLMQQTVPEGKGMMMAVVALDRSEIYQICRDASSAGVVGVALHNSPGQTVISGERQAVLAAADLCEDAGGSVVEIPVSVPFHCELLAPMVPPFAQLVERSNIVDPKLPVIDNVTALPLTDAASVRESLVRQVTAPVLFEESLDYMVGIGVDHFTQCGPGKSLLGFAQRVSRTARTETFELATAAAAQAKTRRTGVDIPDNQYAAGAMQ